MFLLNSRLSLFSAASLEAPLIPKLRGHFAEFLNKGSPVRLRILSSPTCVGLTRVLSFVLGFSPRPPASVCGTGTLTIVSAFSCQRGFTCFATLISLPITAQLTSAYFTTKSPNRLDRLYHQPAHAILLRQRITHKGGTGISTSYPSPTTSVLGLGPDLPWADEPSPGNLGLSTCRFLACISLLIPAFSLLHRPPLLSLRLQPMHYAPLPLH